MKSMQNTLILFVLMAGLVACRGEEAGSETAAEDPWGIISIEPGETLQIAAAVAMNEDVVGPEGSEQYNAVVMAAEQRGSVRGFPIEIIAVDTGCSAGRGPAAALEITRNRRVVAVIGHTCSASCVPSVGTYESANLLVVSPSCGASSLTDELTHTLTFARTIYNDALEGSAAARFAFTEMGARRVAIISDGTADTADISHAFEVTFSDLGGLVVATATISPGQESLRAEIGELQAERPDVLYAPLQAGDAALLTAQLQGTGLAGTPLIGGRHYLSEWYIQGAGLAANDVYAVGPIYDAIRLEGLSEEYARRFGEPFVTYAFPLAYDATSLVLQALEEVVQVDSDGRLQIGRQALRDALFEMVNLAGLSGTLNCSQWGDCGNTPLAVQQVQNNDWITVYIP